MDHNLINLVIPASGEGSRFKSSGYHLPKPLIRVGSHPMIWWVLDNFRLIQDRVNLCIIVQREHNAKHNFKEVIQKNFDFAKVNIIEVDGVTDGALTSVMMAEEHFLDSPLICVNSDQFHEDFDPIKFLESVSNTDGAILTFKDSDPKWSFAETDENNFVKRVAEKRPISDIATTGLYYFKNSWEFCNYAEAMRFWNIRHMGELYLCPIFNEYCRDGKKILAINHPKEKFWGLGTPSDLEAFTEKYLGANK